jgi:isopenicillin-N N-acyltransferase like protein
MRKSKLTWPEACNFAEQFIPMLETSYPSYIEEMKGLAEGAGVSFSSILALNVRTEIGYGMATDGCTAFAWKTSSASFLAQNWDWETEQSPNIISLHISKPGVPHIAMMTEAGILGKIGLNSAGVGVTLNAIAAKGVDTSRLPCHLALRTVLESTSRAEAVSALMKAGIASSCHIQIADALTGAIGLENTAFDTVKMPQNASGICTHSNHFVVPHSTECANKALPDSTDRLARIQTLLKETMDDPSMEGLRDLLKDEKNYPTAICRAVTEKSSLATLFSIVMDLTERYATVKMGRPTERGQELELRP